MSDWPWVIAAFAVTWIGLGAYAALVLGRLRTVRGHVEAQARERPAGEPGEVRE